MNYAYEVFPKNVLFCTIAICGILSLLLSSCHSKVVQTPPNIKINDGGVLSDEPCGAPCFWGIVPGITTKDQVIAIFEERKIFQDCEFFDYSQTRGERGINCKPRIYISFQKNADIVSGLGFRPDQEILVGEVIAKYGNPDAVLVTLQGIPEKPQRLSMILYFDKINTAMVLPEQDSIGSGYELSPTVQITLIRYEEQTEYKSDKKNIPANWQGYGIYDLTR